MAKSPGAHGGFIYHVNKPIDPKLALNLWIGTKPSGQSRVEKTFSRDLSRQQAIKLAIDLIRKCL
jgi:hypothetical protein